MPPLSDWQEDRRGLLKLMAASFALGGLTGCDPASPDGTYVPAVVAPPGIVSGVPNFYATASVVDGTALGIVVEHTMGRPIKVEGNPGHPSSLGATDAFAQALILDFYDPDRAIGIQRQGRPSQRQSLLTALLQQRTRLAETRGRGFRILTGPVSSPTLAAAIGALLQQYPEARWHVWEPFAPESARAGGALAYGSAVEVIPRLDRADVILALDSDLLSTAPGHVRYGRDFAARRNPARASMNRVYAAEATPTLIGSAADHRYPAGPGAMHAIVAGLAAAVLGGAAPSDAPPWLPAVINDLKASPGRAFIHPGPDLPAEAHALLHAVNEKLGGRGRTYDLIEPPLFAAAPLRDLVSEMEDGKVEHLLVIDCNAAFTAPGFEQALARVSFSLSLSPSLDETGKAASWFVPQTHQFETWGDTRAHDGTATITQPQALPLYNGWSPLEVLALFAGSTQGDQVAAVQAAWRNRLATPEQWRDALAAGVIAETAHPTLDLPLRPEAAQARLPTAPAQPVTLLFRPDPHLGDGRWANNAWLQELPRPHTKLGWDNPLLISPELAKNLSVTNADVVAVTAGGTKTELPVWIVPGQAAECAIAVPGNGRRTVGAVGTGMGFDVYPLRAAASGAASVQLSRTGARFALATTDRHYGLDTDTADKLRRRTLAQYNAGDRGQEPGNPKPDTLLYRRKPEGEVQWGMSVDLNACIGCNACVVACQAENNVPVVGKENVLRQREMHWLRIDRYDIAESGPAQPAFQPVLCMHCEQAPCEVVCPVEATQHDEEGLNVMVYNRCVGTRFCSNNCPYKVRRFNYAAYAHAEHRPPIARNPDVSVRTRGVMEKCTFCIQRIVEARIAADRDGTKEQTTTACAAACPTRVFAFGDLNDKDSEVVKRKQGPLDYPLLPETSSYPRVTYETRIRNVNEQAKA